MTEQLSLLKDAPSAKVVSEVEHDLLWRQLLHLACVSMPPGSWDKRFVKDMVAKKKPVALTDKQCEQVRRLAYKYRRQMPCSLVPERVQLPKGGRDAR